MTLEQPNLQVHGIKFWSNLNQLDIIHFRNQLLMSNPGKALENPAFQTALSAYFKAVFQEATCKELQSIFPFLTSKKQKILNVSTEHLGTVGRKRTFKIDLRSKFNILVFLCTNLDYIDFKYQYLYRMGITAACRTLLPSSISQSSHFQSVISGKKLNGMPCHCSADF